MFMAFVNFICKYLVYPLWAPFYRNVVRRIINLFRKKQVEPVEAEEDYLTTLLEGYFRKKTTRKKMINVIVRWKKNNLIRLPFLLEGLKNESNVEEFTKALENMAGDQRIVESVKQFPPEMLIHWIETFRSFCDDYDSNKVACSNSLRLLDWGLSRLDKIRRSQQKYMISLGVLETFSEMLDKFSTSWPELLQEHLQRIIEGTSAIIASGAKIDEPLRNALYKVAEKITVAFKIVMEHPQVDCAYILDGVCTKYGKKDSNLFMIWKNLDQDRACWFLASLFEHIVMSNAYMDTIRNDPDDRDAVKIASSIKKLMVSCCDSCLRNNKTLCDGHARHVLADWLHTYDNKAAGTVQKELRGALKAIHEKTKSKGHYCGRFSICSRADINGPEGRLEGNVKSFLENEESDVLFEYEQNHKVENAEALLKSNDIKLEFLIANNSISKPITKIVEYEPRTNLSSKIKSYFYGITLSPKLTKEELDMIAV